MHFATPLIILLAGLGFGFARGSYQHDWIWLLPAFLLLGLYELDLSKWVSKKIADSLVRIGIMVSGLVLICSLPADIRISFHTPLLAEVRNEGAIGGMRILFLFGFVATVLFLALIKRGDIRKSKNYLAAIFIFIGLGYLLIPFAAPLSAEKLDFRWLFGLCHVLSAWVLYKICSIRYSETDLFRYSWALVYLMFPISVCLLESPWCASASILFMFLSYWFYVVRKNPAFFYICGILAVVSTVGGIDFFSIFSYINSQWTSIQFKTASLLTTIVFIFWLCKRPSFLDIVKALAYIVLLVLSIAPSVTPFGLFLGLLFLEGVSSTEKRFWKRSDLHLGWMLFFLSRFYVIATWPGYSSDTLYYAKVGAKIQQGLLPYRDFVFEYPPFSLLPIYIPEFIAKCLGAVGNIEAYRFLHLIIYFLVDLLFARYLFYKKEEKKIDETGLFIYLFGSLVLCDLLYDRMDLILGTILTVGILHAAESKYIKSITWLLVGAFFKLVPSIALPLVGVRLFREKFSVEKKFSVIAAGAGVLVALMALCYLFFGWSFLSFLTYHRLRGIQAESMWASIEFAFREINGKSVEATASYGALHLVNPMPWLLTFGNMAPIVALAGLYAWSLVYSKTWSTITWVRCSFLAVVIFIILNKVFSPQFFIWLVCLIPFCKFEDLKGKKELWILFAVSLLLTGFVFHYYVYFALRYRVFWYLILVRNFVLLAFMFKVWSNLWSSSVHRD